MDRSEPADAQRPQGAWMRWLRPGIGQASRRSRRHVHDWLEAHPRVSHLLERSGCLHVDEFTLARGLAVGLLVGLTPTVGIQTPMMLIASLTFRANFVVAFIVSNVTNPFTIAPLYYGFNRLGEWLMERLPISPAAVVDLGDEIAHETLAMFVGSMTVAIPAATLGYFLFLWLGRLLDLHGPARHTVPGEDLSAD